MKKRTTLLVISIFILIVCGGYIFNMISANRQPHVKIIKKYTKKDTVSILEEPLRQGYSFLNYYNIPVEEDGYIYAFINEENKYNLNTHFIVRGVDINKLEENAKIMSIKDYDFYYLNHNFFSDQRLIFKLIDDKLIAIETTKEDYYSIGEQGIVDMFSYITGESSNKELIKLHLQEKREDDTYWARKSTLSNEIDNTPSLYLYPAEKTVNSYLYPSEEIEKEMVERSATILGSSDKDKSEIKIMVTSKYKKPLTLENNGITSIPKKNIFYLHLPKEHTNLLDFSKDEPISDTQMENKSTSRALIYKDKTTVVYGSETTSEKVEIKENQLSYINMYYFPFFRFNEEYPIRIHVEGEAYLIDKYTVQEEYTITSSDRLKKTERELQQIFYGFLFSFQV